MTPLGIEPATFRFVAPSLLLLPLQAAVCCRTYGVHFTGYLGAAVLNRQQATLEHMNEEQRTRKSVFKKRKPSVLQAGVQPFILPELLQQEAQDRVQHAHVRPSLAVCPSVYSLPTPRCLRLSSLFSLPETERKKRRYCL